MKHWLFFSPLLLLATAACTASFTSQSSVDPESRKVLLENDRVVVKQVILEPGVEYPEHRHKRPHVGVIVRGGTLEFHEAGEVETVHFEPGQAGWRDAGVTHRIVNRSDTTVHVVEVELK